MVGGAGGIFHVGSKLLDVEGLVKGRPDASASGGEVDEGVDNVAGFADGLNGEVTSHEWSGGLESYECAICTLDVAACGGGAGEDGVARRVLVEPQDVLVVGCAIDDVWSSTVSGERWRAEGLDLCSVWVEEVAIVVPGCEVR